MAGDGRCGSCSSLGQAGDNPQLLPLLDGISVGRDGPGRPRSRPEVVILDKVYSHPSTRQAMRQRGIRMVCPERYAKRTACYQAELTIAATILWRR